MPVNYKVSDELLETAESRGYNWDELVVEARKFIHNYTAGTGYKTKVKDWDQHFLESWLENAYGWGRIEKNGKYKGSEDSQMDIYQRIYDNFGND